ncbi:SMI1/KNR4 family protein [Streptomyces sp. NPDC050803]|uniref:SMI1/KNR4 family protein n=1 Tax=unclassified Streptomyces TaxID=2593676 RepID=UPI00344102BE
MVEQAVRPIVAEIIEQAPEGWTHAVLHARAGRGGTSATGGYVPAANPWTARVPAPHQEIMALGTRLGAERGWERVSLEIRCRPSGEWRLVAFHDAVTYETGSGGAFQVVLDADHRLAQPGLRQEAGTAAPAGDPEVAVARFHTYLERRAAILGRRDQLPAPATPAAIEEAERRLGRRLPADLRALYLIADGDCVDYGSRGLFRGNSWLSLAELVAEYGEWGASERPWYGWDLEWDSVVFDAAPGDTVRRCGGHPGWLRFGSSEDGNYLAVDTDPARSGRPGQVIRTGRDYDDGPVYVADSVTSLLGHYLELLDQGAYERHGDHISLRAPARDTGPRQIVGAIPDEVPPTLQAIHINDAPGLVDLAPLTAAAHLRLLHLNRSATADLTPVRQLPVESLRVTLPDGDLTALTGHPHLASLDLTTTVPVDAGRLRTVPRLHGLDLSRANVPDPAPLADLAELRYLSLTGSQWAALLDGHKAPPALAAAALAGKDAGFDDALAWAARLGLDTGDALRVTGTFKSAGA